PPPFTHITPLSLSLVFYVSHSLLILIPHISLSSLHHLSPSTSLSLSLPPLSLSVLLSLTVPHSIPSPALQCQGGSFWLTRENAEFVSFSVLPLVSFSFFLSIYLSVR